MVRRLRIVGALSLLLMEGATVAAEPRVVATIKPVHSLVAGVMAEVGEPVLLVRGGSPHGYALRPSGARALSDADVVFWVGPELETFLAKPLEALAADAMVVALADVDGVRRLPAREGGVWEMEPHQHGPDDASSLDGHDEEGGHHINPHVWLDPRNAQMMVAAIAAALRRTDAANATTYQANAEGLQARLAELDAATRRKLAPVADRPFVVFHDAYPYFEDRYGLNAVGSITVDPDRRPGAKRLQKIRTKLSELGAACVFAEPQFEPALVDTVVEGTAAGKGVLDPLGADLAPGPDHYFQLVIGLADSLVACLGHSTSN